MPKRAIPVGSRFSRLVILEEIAERKRGLRQYICQCDCGKTITVTGAALNSGNPRSCGCLAREVWAASNRKRLTRHGRAHKGQSDPTYNSWENMKQRCLNHNHKRYAQYGGRGIKICDRWLGEDGFAHFLEDMGERPSGETLDRINVEGNYEKDNCQWLSNLKQQTNRQPTKRRINNTSGYLGVTKTKCGWIAEIRYQKARHYLGHYREAIDAGRAVEAFRRKHIANYQPDRSLDPIV